MAVTLSPLLILAGCTAGGGDTPGATTSSTSATTGSTSSGTATSAPTTSGRGRDHGHDPRDENLPGDASFPADTSDDGGSAQAGAQSDPTGQTRISGLRTGHHHGYDRLVIDLNSRGVPDWTVGYSEPTGPGGGPVDIAGAAFLRVVLHTGAEPGGQSQIDVSSSPGSIAQVRTTGFFEGDEEVLVGIRDGQQPFRAFALTDPARIVVDIQDH